MAFHLTEEEVWITHVNYELSTLCEMPTLAARYDESGPGSVKNACLESALLHGRLLIEFLVGRPQRNGGRSRSSRDVAPTDFLPGWEYPEPERFDQYLEIIDPHVAHLSKQRSNIGTPKPGYLTSLADDILAGVHFFAQALVAAGSPYASNFQTAVTQGKAYRSRGPNHWP